MSTRKYFPEMVINGWRLVERVESWRWVGVCVECGRYRTRTITIFREFHCLHGDRPRFRKWRHNNFVQAFKNYGSLYGDLYHRSIATQTERDLIRKFGPTRIEEEALIGASTDPTWTSRPKGGKGYWPDEDREEGEEDEEETTSEEDDLPRGEPLPSDPRDRDGFTVDENTQIWMAHNFAHVVQEARRRGERIEHIVERAKAVGIPEHIAYRMLGIFRAAPTLDSDEDRHDLLELEHRLYLAIRRKLREPLPFKGKYRSLRSLPINRHVSDHMAISRYEQTKEEIIRRHWLGRYASGDVTIDDLPVSSLGHLTHRLQKTITKKGIHSVGELLRRHARGGLYELGVLDIQRITELLEAYDLLDDPKEENADRSA